MSENLGLGRIITTAQERDAVHVAVAPCTAGQRLVAGDKVWLDGGLARRGGMGSIGVVDPFLSSPVLEGQQFWLFLNPGSITSLRHDWTHPAFAESHRISGAKDYLEQFASRLGSPLVDVLSAIHEGHFCLPNDLNEYGLELDDVFWANYSAYTGNAKPSDASEYFRCAC